MALYINKRKIQNDLIIVFKKRLTDIAENPIFGIVIARTDPMVKNFAFLQRGRETMERFPAHIRIEKNGAAVIQETADHLFNVAAGCERELLSMRLSKTGRLAGLLHDIGKFTVKFADYIKRSSSGEKIAKGSVNHTFASVIYLNDKISAFGNNSIRERTAAEILSYAIGAHHGLFDCIAPDGSDGFRHRLDYDRNELCYDEACDNFETLCVENSIDISELISFSLAEIDSFLMCCAPSFPDKAQFIFAAGMTSRLILSALINADRSDTAGFMTGCVHRSAILEDMSGFWREKLETLENKLSRFSKEDEISKARGKISDICRKFAENPSSIHRLTVPTGSGKTLSSLRYGAAHAARFNKKRIFYIAPLLTVIDQNADVIRGCFGSDSVLEHHSDYIKSDLEQDELDKYELLSENWDSPVVITTLVQFLDTLFSSRTQCIRRFRALADSVIIIDEIQSVPFNMVSQVNAALNFLAYAAGASVVLCSATQPGFETAKHKLKFGEAVDIVPYSDDLSRIFKRVEIIDRCRPQGYEASEIADFICGKIKETESLLLICNTRAVAGDVYRAVKMMLSADNSDTLVCHLSAAICKAHRKDVLDKVNFALKRRARRVVCVATQLVEAGVDFSFECVIRLSAGIDNIAQASGRCNRNGEYPHICRTYIMNARDEKLGPLKSIRSSQKAADCVLYEYSRFPAEFGDNLLSEKSVRRYYECLFSDKKVSSSFDYPVSDMHTSIFEMLSENRDFRQNASEGPGLIGQAFKSAGISFKVFEDTSDIIVPYNEEAETLIADICSERAKYDMVYLFSKVHAAKPYIVSVYASSFKLLYDLGGIAVPEKTQTAVLRPDFYDKEVGIGSGEIVL